MSRSRRKTPISGLTTVGSNKSFKLDEHRAERCKVRVAVRVGDELPHPKEYGNEWKSPRDGKQLIDPKSKWMRK